MGTVAALDWSALITGVIAAAVALAGVYLTQRNQERLVHDSRIWAERARVYVELIAWARALEYAARERRPLPNGDPPDEAWDRAWAYASGEVLRAANAVREMAYPGAVGLDAVEVAARTLRIIARNELQAGRPRRRRWLGSARSTD
jgi:hypothetical protein